MLVYRRGPRRAAELALIHVATLELGLMVIGEEVMTGRASQLADRRAATLGSSFSAQEWLMLDLPYRHLVPHMLQDD